MRNSVGRFMATVAVCATAAVVTATPGSAQKGVSNPMAEALTFCETGAADISGGALSALGWAVDDQGVYGPYFSSVNVSRNGGDDYGYVSVQPFATVQVVYCTYDVYIDNTTFDMAAAAQQLGFTGETQVFDGDTYGTWELTSDGEGKLVQANLSGNYFYLELTWVRDLP